VQFSSNSPSGNAEFDNENVKVFMFEDIIQKHVIERVESIPRGTRKLANEDEYKTILVRGKALYMERAPLWLVYDSWTIEEAARLLSGLLPSNDQGGFFFDQTYYLDKEKFRAVHSILQLFHRNFQCLTHVEELLRRSPIGRHASPKVWAEYARAKGLLPTSEYWDDIDNSPLLSLLEAKDAPVSVSKCDAELARPQLRPISIYSTDWLAIQNATITRFFSPRRNPDAKREEVVDWIISEAARAGLQESKNIAVAIFTIIKPDDHDPKKKRVEPS
jgi:hypothetical protein